MGLRGLVVAVALCVLGVVGCAHSAPVMNPDPIAAAVSPEITEMAVLDALPRRRWIPEEVQPGRIVASLPVKSFLVRAEILYDQSQVRIRYLNSDNLREQVGADGQVYAHKNVNKWLRALAIGISRALADTVNAPPPAQVAGGEGAPLAAPLLGSALAPAEDAAPAGQQPMAPVPVAPE